MRQIVELSIDNILNTAIAESGQVFRGVRSMAEDTESASTIDNASADLLLTEDEKGAMRQHLNVFIGEMYDTIRGYCPEYGMNENTLVFVIEGAEDCNTAVRIQPLIEFYFVYRILAWWLSLPQWRDWRITTCCFADDYRQQVLSVIVPKFSTRKLRYI